MSSKQRKKRSRPSFGATAPPFIDYLKDILRRYPDGGQILKELIQNADDAQATKVVFIHDERSYGTESLWNDELQKFQGPALYAYNDAAFTDEDWEGIQNVGRSVKRNDPTKVGRFGIGFNSVYHTTDVPGIFSSGYLGLMDPQEKVFGERTGGFQWCLKDTEDQEALMNLHDQFQPFRDIVSLVSGQDWSEVVQEHQHFEGTVFRFPLRNEASVISDNLYDSDRVVELFDSFIADADLSLLFLKSVTSVSLKYIDVNGTVTTRLDVTCSAPTEITLESDDLSIIDSLTRFKQITLNSEIEEKSKWLVTTCTMKEGHVEELDVLSEKLSFIPRVDLAFPCDKMRDCSQSRLSCFLPLPNNESNKTGLPVHINAYFGLTDNRRHIKWQEEDQKHDEQAQWNELLIKEVLPHAYFMIIKDAITLAQMSVLPVSSVYELWPDIAQTQHKEKWHDVTLDVFHQLFKVNEAILSLAKDERQFVSPSEAVFPCNDSRSTDILSAIKKTLINYGENLVALPASVEHAINMAYPDQSSLNYVTPSYIRNILRNDVYAMDREDKLCLLEYVLSDGNYKELSGLQLLPLSNGSFISFTSSTEDTALIDSKDFPRILLPFCSHLFIPEDLSTTCKAHLEQIGRKNLFKVINIDARRVAAYMREFLPTDWKQPTTGVVLWDIGNDQHPPPKWIQEFWKFLNTHFNELCQFIDMPLIPVSPVSLDEPVLLAKLQHNTTFISMTSKESSLPDYVGELVSNIGGTVVRGNEWLKHNNLGSYLLCPSPRNVLKVLMNLGSQHVIKKLQTVSPRAQDELKDYLSRLDSLSNQEKTFLLNLPLFQTVKGFCVAAHSKQAVLLRSDLKLPPELPFPDSVVQCATEADRRLFQLLQIKLINVAEAATFLLDVIEKRNCTSKDIEKIMTWILQHGNILFSHKPLKKRCNDLKFIETNGGLKKISNFFDPRVKHFTVIFESEMFPPTKYTTTKQMKESLSALGLVNKDEDVLPEHFLHAAKSIEIKSLNSQMEALERAQILLQILDSTNLLSKFSDKDLQHLKMIKWVPCDQQGNNKRLLGEKKQKQSFFCPEEMRHSRFKDIVGHVMPLVENLSDRVSNKLGLKRSPPPEKVLKNLSVLSSKAKKMADPDTDVDFKRKLHSIYKHMQENMSTFSALNKGMPWLWNFHRFVSPQDLVLEYPQDLDLSSYIGKVPKEYLPYKSLLLECGLKTLCSNEDIFGILRSIQKTIEDRTPPFATSSEIKVSVEILNWLWRGRRKVPDDIPVPVITEDEQCTLKPLSKAVFCDVSKLSLNELECSQDEVYVLHEEIPKATAEWLNIRLISTYILDPEQVGIEQCGQSEPITTRIKNILKEYDEESDIFKELIQNAEDAKANTCKFLVDFRVHKDAAKTLIDPDMALCQGPCLWAYNNEQFTAEDWDNIVRVGAASKENKAEKIGQFGLGFNTVYHVTDIPSILSGKSLLILDPNVTHLKKHIKNKSNPGLKLDLSQQRPFRYFPGQFTPYERIFDCNFSHGCPEPYPGTLIKLPFRCEEEALNSEISKKVFSRHDINAIQKQFTQDSQMHLLFLRNIDTISLQCLSNNASTPPRDDEIKTIFTVSKNEMTTTNPDENCLTKQHQAEQLLMKLDGSCKQLIDCSAINIVQITSERSDKTDSQTWLLYNCFGTSQALKMALQENKKANFSLPIGGIAVPLQNNPEPGKLSTLQTDLLGRAFCFLPLAIDTGLPVNVNGTFAVTSNRKGLWESGKKNEWNKALLQDPVVTAYVTALLTLKEMAENNQLDNYCYHKFWPDREKVSDAFKPLVDAFYFAIAMSYATRELLRDGEKWCSLNNAVFLHESIEKDKNIAELLVRVCKKFIKAPQCVVFLPSWLRNSFKLAGQGKVLEDRTWNWGMIYTEVVFKNLSTMDMKTRDTLVLHAMDLQITELDELLLKFPCIPTKDGQLQYIKKLVNPTGRVACLFESENGRLLGGTKNDFCSPKRIQRLLQLGMANDHLSLEDITKEALKMTKTWNINQEKAYKQLKCLLELMKEHRDDENSLHWETLRDTAFLPAFSPGDTKLKTVELRKPVQIFNDKCAPLVNLTQPVLDHNKLKIHNANPILQILGVHDNPKPESVLQQLQTANEQSGSIDRSILHNIAYECYRFLDQRLTDLHDIAFISQRAKSFPFILIGDKFVDVSDVAENEEFEAKPYLHVLPQAFAAFGNLWKCVGVKKKFTIDQFLTVLQKLQSRYGAKPLLNNNLSICLNVLNIGIYGAKNKTDKDCLIPNEHGVLQHASQLCFNDSPWMPVTSDVTLCHERIPRVVARHFGVRTTRHHTLESQVNEDISPYAFDFQQHEELTVRIKNIISAYPSKKDILKELIQNADDAEATEVHFVWDKRQHRKEKTFGTKWNKLQGPALCVFNNKVFTDEDLRGIQQLGEGGKQNSPGKIGKYGVGFNSVFHLTDCPSILTGDEKLCISDPNQKYIESHSNKQRTGIGYDMPDHFKNTYIDVYNSYLPNLFPLKEGTMFRLPLRMGTNANSSKISTQAVTENDIMELNSALSEDPEGLILFLKNITKIEFHVINEETKKLKTMFTVEKHLPNNNKGKKMAFKESLENALKSDEPTTAHKTFYNATITTSDKEKSTWIVAEQFGSFKESSEIKMSGKLPQAALAARVSAKDLLPQNQNFSGAAFCSLPLPGKTGLPVHVNGNFEVDSSRRNLWKQDGQSVKSNWNEALKQDVIAPLYADLLYCIRCLAKIKKVSFSSVEICFNQNYLCFWPLVSKDVGKDWQEMINEVYKAIKEKKLDVIPVIRTSVRTVGDIAFTECSFDWCCIYETETTEAPHLTDSKNGKINPILEDLGMKLVPNSHYMSLIWTHFKSAGVDVKRVNPTSVLTFLKTKPLNDPNKTNEDLPLPITDTLIRDKKRCSELLSFCLTNLKKENYILLNGLPLLLTTDNVLRVFNSSSPKLMTRYERLFFRYKDQFADNETNEEHSDVLEALNLVRHLTVPNAVKFLKPLLQHLLQTCEVDQSVGLHVPDENILKWLKMFWWFLTSEVRSAAPVDNEKCLKWHDVRRLLSDCCVVPVVCPKHNNKHFLQTMAGMSSVVRFFSDDDLSSILFKLGFMKLDAVFFHDIFGFLHSLLHPEFLDPKNKNSVLDQVCTINHSEFSQLARDELKELQEFLQSGVSKAKDGDHYKWKLKSLPIYETVSGQRVRIDGAKEVFVLKCEYSVKFPDLFSLPNSNSIFLQNSPENIVLAGMLKIEILRDLDYFMKFLLPVVHTLTENQTLQCLKLLLVLQRLHNYQEFQGNIISSLKTVRLIENSQGVKQTASYYFDNEDELFRLMVPQEKFVPERFWMQLSQKDSFVLGQAKHLIRELGMKHCVSEDDIRNFAYQIQSEAQGNGDVTDLREKSKLVFQAALEKCSADEHKGGKLLQSLADVKFLFPVKIKEELCKYNQPFATGRSTVKIRGSLIQSSAQHQDLIWSSMPIVHVPFHMLKNLQEFLKNVGAHKKPPPNCVMDNLRNICQLQCHTKELLTTRSHVFRNSYAYLQVNGFDKEQLAGLPLILVEKDTKLLKVELVSLSLDYENELRPYLYKISSEDVIYADFFKKLGVTREATIVQYCNVLAAVHAESHHKPGLNPNQLKTVKRAVQQLFKLIKGEENSAVNHVQQLYLPAVDGKLYPSSTLYCNDTAFEARRLKEAVKDTILLMEKLSECHLDIDIFDQLKLLQMLPTKLRPKMLSQFIKEKTAESLMELCELGTGCEFRQFFEGHLSSTAFRHGLVCIIRQLSQGKITQDEAAQMCEKKFGCIQIVCCKILKTVLWLEQEALQQSAKDTDVCVKREEQGCVFYLKHNDISALKVLNEVTQTLTKEINVLLGNVISLEFLMVVCQLLLCDNLEDVQKTLAKNGILDSAESAINCFKPPDPGTEIPVEWHDSLDMDILNNFEEGEFVGYCIDEKYIYAIIVEELPGPFGLLSRRYKIDVGQDEPIEVSSLDLYQFKQTPKLISTGAEASGMELELFEGAVPHSSQKPARQLPTSVEEAKREIDKCLAEIWKLPEKERLNAIKRLYLRWHPDKNPDSEFIATEAFKYLKNKIEELTTGKSKTQSAGSSHYRGYSNFQNFYQQWNQEARHHRRGREQFFRHFGHSYNFWSFNRNVPRPNKEEARRWYRQASCDLDAAHKDLGLGSPEWFLFKVHQAVEKALIAVEYKRNGQQPSNSPILAIAVRISRFNPQLGDLPEMVKTLMLLGVDAKKTQYPNCHPFPRIPHEQFKPENEALVLSKATEVLETLKAYIHK